MSTEQYGLLGHLIAGLPAVLAAGVVAQCTFGGQALTTARMTESAGAYAAYVDAVQEVQSTSETYEVAKREADEAKRALDQARELAQQLAEKMAHAAVRSDEMAAGKGLEQSELFRMAQRAAAEEMEAVQVAQTAEAGADDEEKKLEEAQLRLNQAAGRVVVYGSEPVVKAVARAIESEGGRDEVIAVIEAMREEAGIKYTRDCDIRMVLFSDPCLDD